MNREILLEWIEEAYRAKPGEQAFIPVETKSDQKRLLKEFVKELNILKAIDPIKGGCILPSATFRDHRLWVVLTRVSVSPLIGFIKRADGKLERVQVSLSQERKRLLSMMISDGLSAEEIEDLIEGSLEEEELEWIKIQKKRQS